MSTEPTKPESEQSVSEGEKVEAGSEGTFGGTRKKTIAVEGQRVPDVPVTKAEVRIEIRLPLVAAVLRKNGEDSPSCRAKLPDSEWLGSASSPGPV